MHRAASISIVTLLVLGAASAAFYWFQLRPKLADSAAYLSRPHAILDRARSAVELYKLEKGRYPTTDEGLGALVAAGLLPAVPLDPWNRPFNYRHPSSRPSVPFELWSLGADGSEGGGGENADIGNWNDTR
jgi:general secretion pathway protein G